jgi:hypothetical protein
LVSDRLAKMLSIKYFLEKKTDGRACATFDGWIHFSCLGRGVCQGIDARLDVLQIGRQFVREDIGVVYFLQRQQVSAGAASTRQLAYTYIHSTHKEKDEPYSRNYSPASILGRENKRHKALS